MNSRRLGLAGGVLVIVGVVLIGASAVLASNPQAGSSCWFGGLMGRLWLWPGHDGQRSGL